MSANEFMAQLEKDEEYQRKQAAFSAEVVERTNVRRVAAQPIVAALRGFGVQVDSVGSGEHLRALSGCRRFSWSVWSVAATLTG